MPPIPVAFLASFLWLVSLSRTCSPQPHHIWFSGVNLGTASVSDLLCVLWKLWKPVLSLCPQRLPQAWAWDRMTVGGRAGKGGRGRAVLRGKPGWGAVWEQCHHPFLIPVTQHHQGRMTLEENGCVALKVLESFWIREGVPSGPLSKTNWEGLLTCECIQHPFLLQVSGFLPEWLIQSILRVETELVLPATLLVWLGTTRNALNDNKSLLSLLNTLGN